jgi:hypothetical protein
VKIKITQAAIEAGKKALDQTYVSGPATDEYVVEKIIEAAFPHLAPPIQPTPAPSSLVNDAGEGGLNSEEVERVARAMCFAWHEAHEVTLSNDDWTSMHLEGQAKWKKTARAAIRAIREGGERWGVWDKMVGGFFEQIDGFPTSSTTDKQFAERIVIYAKYRGYDAEVRPYTPARAKTPEEIAIGELQDIADNGLRCDTNPTIQITTSANDTALRYVKYIQSVDEAMRDRAKNALAAIRDASKEKTDGK